MTTPRPFNRRHFMRVGAATLAGGPLVRQAAAAPADMMFTHGVASGDPLADRVILWTRVAPAAGRPVPVMWEVALDAGFRQPLRRGRVITGPERDYTVKVDVLGLPPDTALHYRFFTLGRQSAVGRTRTLPLALVPQIKLAVFSCANYPAGYFHAYAHAAARLDLDAVVHLGDYLYEYPAGGYASEDAARLGRVSAPTTELLTLQDYRQRHAQYRSDPDLQALHAALPFICVWDDHEIANDTWREGAENHDPATEGSFALRRSQALRAYHEWMPIRSPDLQRLDHIYRAFSFGPLMDLVMLDTRVVGRDLQLDYGNYIGATGFDAARFGADMANPQRQLLGAEQSAWLAQTLARGRGLWTVLGQQVLMGRMNVPAPLVLFQINFGDYVALLAKAQTAPQTLTPREQAILTQPAIPYNLDAWDGYAVARETLLGTARALNKNLVVLAGDTHNAWASNLADLNGNAVGVEFATPGVSSPGLEAFFPNENPVVVARGLEQIIGPLAYADTQYRGYMVVTATPQECRADWHFVSTVKQKSYDSFVGKTLRTLPGAGSRVLVG